MEGISRGRKHQLPVAEHGSNQSRGCALASSTSTMLKDNFYTSSATVNKHTWRFAMANTWRKEPQHLGKGEGFPLERRESQLGFLLGLSVAPTRPPPVRLWQACRSASGAGPSAFDS
ncbi:hypothetical protein BDA96_10G038900 [Sorghum bicolor]|uniref:Uncharacterized protein n=1 Tax=Sorghum bicolor TaxID=4558 RepID=A0A921TZQ5_SORBI|nr:hypothetical protein BDA96_10G038900 [Sorghum bicolor]